MNLQDKIRGCFIGGTIGDALGYPVEFHDYQRIIQKHGPEGITSYTLSPYTGTAVISDDTQMTLFTATGLLWDDPTPIRQRVLQAYLGWLYTQEGSYCKENRIPDGSPAQASGYLRDVPQLYICRAPGMTCLSGLRLRRRQMQAGETVADFLAQPINQSKGCGGVMRVAPMGLSQALTDPDARALEGAQLAAITHTHSLGYIPAAALTHMIAMLAHDRADLKTAVTDARNRMETLFAGDPFLGEMTNILNAAITLAENDRPDVENIDTLGEGWVAEEALAIAVYCCLRHPEDFSAAIIAAVNHKGDSDSTGAIAGNIMGTLLGYSRIDPRWLSDLELHDQILQLADDFFATKA